MVKQVSLNMIYANWRTFWQMTIPHWYLSVRFFLERVLCSLCCSLLGLDTKTCQAIPCGKRRGGKSRQKYVVSHSLDDGKNPRPAVSALCITRFSYLPRPLPIYACNLFGSLRSMPSWKTHALYSAEAFLARSWSRHTFSSPLPLAKFELCSLRSRRQNR